ncbi:MAG: IS66 family transposase [Chitinophagales bacterium]
MIAEINSHFEQKLAQKEARIRELEDQLSKNSQNSSKPPSTDSPYGKTEKPAPKSRREKTERKIGGQYGHKGSNLKMVEISDHTVVYKVKRCTCCGEDLSNCSIKSILRRQVYDIPPLKLTVTEHQAEVKKCVCGYTTKADFPKTVPHYVQYGSHIRGFLIYLQNYQFLPYERTKELIADLFKHNLSTGTLSNTQKYAFEQLEVFEEQLKALLTLATVAGFDETGFRVLSKCWWLHSCSTDKHAYYQVHEKRGNEAMDAIGILPDFEGIAIHDFWKSYLKYTCTHGLCNAHLLRELTFIKDRFKQNWAEDLASLLCEMKTARDKAVEQGKTALREQELTQYAKKYSTIIEEGFKANPFTPPKKKKRGPVAKTKALNLLERMRNHKEDIMRFLFDFNVPFDNNFSERDIRMMKLKQKISGCFRSKTGAKYFARIRSYIITARKQGVNVFEALINLFEDNSTFSKLLY